MSIIHKYATAFMAMYVIGALSMLGASLCLLVYGTSIISIFSVGTLTNNLVATPVQLSDFLVASRCGIVMTIAICCVSISHVIVKNCQNATASSLGRMAGAGIILGAMLLTLVIQSTEHSLFEMNHVSHEISQNHMHHMIYMGSLVCRIGFAVLSLSALLLVISAAVSFTSSKACSSNETPKNRLLASVVASMLVGSAVCVALFGMSYLRGIGIDAVLRGSFKLDDVFKPVVSIWRELKIAIAGWGLMGIILTVVASLRSD